MDKTEQFELFISAFAKAFAKSLPKVEFNVSTQDDLCKTDFLEDEIQYSIYDHCFNLNVVTATEEYRMYIMLDIDYIPRYMAVNLIHSDTQLDMNLNYENSIFDLRTFLRFTQDIAYIFKSPMMRLTMVCEMGDKALDFGRYESFDRRLVHDLAAQTDCMYNDVPSPDFTFIQYAESIGVLPNFLDVPTLRRSHCDLDMGDTYYYLRVLRYTGRGISIPERCKERIVRALRKCDLYNLSCASYTDALTVVIKKLDDEQYYRLAKQLKPIFGIYLQSGAV